MIEPCPEVLFLEHFLLVSAGDTAGRADFERSFVDVSSEADAIRDNDRHSGLYVNNNEKCDDFEVIDDGSQPGGIRNFEDKSFERSGRSSLLSSARTELATDSVESEVPLEISVNVEKNNKEDYDIVQMEDSTKFKKSTLLDIERLSGANELVHSPAASSNINIDKYLFSDNDDDGSDETESSSTFNINMYFATEEKNNGNALVEETTEVEDSTQSKIVSNEKVCVQNEDKECDPEQKEGDSSPFLEVNSELTADLPTEDDNGNVESGVGNKNEFSNKSISSFSEKDLNQAFVSNDIQETAAANEIESNSRENDLQSDTDDTNTLSVEDKGKEVRKSVEDFYESILSDETPQGHASEGLPPGATFGEPIGLSASYDNEGENEPATSPTETTQRKEGWLVRVESFSTPASCTPQIKVIGDEESERQKKETTCEGGDGSEQSPVPVPKQRKKHSKKKKRQKSVDIVKANDDNAAEDPPPVVDSNLSGSPLVSPSKTLDHSDIPKQFLDASTTLGSGSISDLSDAEQEVLEDGTTVNKKRSGSKKKNKEGCKTQ